MPIKKITIYGNFWDVYLYKNLLFLFLFEGKEVKIVDWEKLIKMISQDERTKIAYKCAFLNSDYLYKEVQNHIFDDNDFKDLLLKKFEEMTDIVIRMEDNFFVAALYGAAETKYPFYFSDLVLYNKIMYIAGENGVYRSSIPKTPHKRKSHLSFSQIESTAKINVCSMKIMRGRLIISAQDDGLYEYDNSIKTGTNQFNALERISARHSSYTGINYSSILSSSYIAEDSFIHRDYRNDPGGNLQRYVKDDILISTVFGDERKQGFYFSLNERIYQIIDGKISYCVFCQSRNNQDGAFSAFKEVNYDIKTSDIVTASSEEFGVVIQFKDRLLVLLSDDTIEEYKEENNKIISYVTYPNSNCYSNQLHIIYDNKIDIISFNQDYFVDQNNKMYGVKHSYKDSE